MGFVAGSVTRLTGRREYVRVGLTAAFPAAEPVNRATEPAYLALK